MKKILIVIVILIVAGGIWYVRSRSPGTSPSSQVDLNRPLIVGLVSWPGYAGGITANGGFQENMNSIFYKKYGLLVKFVLIEDIDARGKAFAKGGPEGVDVVWSTVDFWANELPQYVKGGLHPKAFLQVDWSRGGDAIVADQSIRTIEDLKGKKIALVQYTPSHWFLESMLKTSKLSEAEKDQIRKNLVFTQDVPSARAVFTSGKADAAVVWEPDVQEALKRPNAHILVSSRDVPNLIADVMVAQQEFINAHPRTMEAFVRGWLDGVQEAKTHPDLAAQLLVNNEPLFKDLGLASTTESLNWVYWPDLADNAHMFGLDKQPPVFDPLFSEASQTWKALGAIDNVVAPEDAKDPAILERVYAGK
jgi:NitT/TauT family transport system substrate-binding protein